MLARIGVLTVIAACVTLTACRSSGRSQNQSSITAQDSAALTPQERRTVSHLLQCEECSDGELDAVKKLADRKPAVIDTLREQLLRGPSPEARSRLRRQFLQTYREDSLFQSSSPDDLAELHSPAVVESSDQFVNHYLGNYVALYRVRAATALARIGGSKARAALDSAMTGHLPIPGDTLRRDVLIAIRVARSRIRPGGP
jgi:hypothetical protein